MLRSTLSALTFERVRSSARGLRNECFGLAKCAAGDAAGWCPKPCEGALAFSFLGSAGVAAAAHKTRREAASSALSSSHTLPYTKHREFSSVAALSSPFLLDFRSLG